jgi:DNA-3-methyladenine glycosylase II
MALRKLAASDPDIAAALAQVGQPPPRDRPPGFATLLRIIVAQQISAAAARSLWTKLTTAIDPLTPAALAARPPEELRSFGLSRQKAAYALGLAGDMACGRVDLDRVAGLDDEAAIEHLVQVKGIGRWSAEVYLLFALRRPDVWPAADLALQTAMRRLKRLRRQPDPKRMYKLAEPWRPYRSAAAHLLWHYYATAPVD